MHPASVLSFDVGLRNLGAALLERDPLFRWPPAAAVGAAATAQAHQQLLLAHFALHGWRLARAENIDTTRFHARQVRNCKKLPLVAVAGVVAATVRYLNAEWGLGAGAPAHVVTETQPFGATMKAVSAALPAALMMAYPEDTAFTAASGGHKLKVCAALGVEEGAGLQAAAVAPKAVARRSRKRPAVGTGEDPGADGPRVAPIRPHKSNPKYEDNKWRGVLACKRLLASRAPGWLRAEDPALAAKLQDPNVADAVLQGVWALFCLEPGKPRRRPRGRTAAAPVVHVLPPPTPSPPPLLPASAQPADEGAE